MLRAEKKAGKKENDTCFMWQPWKEENNIFHTMVLKGSFCM